MDKIPYFQCDFSSLSTERLSEICAALDDLSYCVDLNSEKVTDVWKVLSRMGQLVRSEIYSRNPAKKPVLRGKKKSTPVLPVGKMKSCKPPVTRRLTK